MRPAGTVILDSLRFQDFPIKHKLVCIIMLTTIATLLLAGIGVIITESILLRTYAEKDLSSLAQIVADNSTAALAFDDQTAASEMLATLKSRAHLVSACIYRATGDIFTSFKRSDSAAECSIPDVSKEIKISGGNLTLSQPIFLNQKRIGALVLQYDLGEVTERIRSYAEIVLSLLFLACLVALLLCYKLGAIIGGPISQLARTATAVSETRNYGLRAEKKSNDELGVLVGAFNEMLSRVQSQDHDLRMALDAREDALHEAQRARDSLRTTLESIADAVVSTDLSGRIVFANRVAQNMVKATEADLIGQDFDRLFPILNELTRERLIEPVETVVREGTIADLGNHTALVAADGTEIPVDECGSPVKSEDGAVQGIVFVFRDVTVRRRADETSRLLASIVESSTDAIIGKDLDGIVRTWNQGAERIFGYSADEMVGRSISTIAAPERAEEMTLIRERVSKGERIDHHQTVCCTKDGIRINVSLATSPLYSALGRIVGVSQIARDITEQVNTALRLEQLNSELRKSNERLARSNEDLVRFVFVASHDLQEPLRMISIYSQLLVESHAGESDSRRAVFLDFIVGGTTRMRQLLADLLAYVEMGVETERPLATVDLNLILNDVRRNLDAIISSAQAKIFVDPLPSVCVYEGHFLSVFQNLVENAIKYRSERPPEIRISHEQSGADLRFSVADNGIGIGAEYHEKIFSAFKRLHGNKIPGTGIGLAICQRVVERYGGRIWLESEVGRGTTFYFTLPTAEHHAERI